MSREIKLSVELYDDCCVQVLTFTADGLRDEGFNSRNIASALHVIEALLRGTRPRKHYRSIRDR